MNNIYVLIPTLNPKESLLTVINKLQKYNLKIIIVDDGSENKQILNNLNNVTILTHSKNKGKGEALKTGFKYLINKKFKGVITVDDDQQHDITDILNICNNFLKTGTTIVGIRSFNKNTPIIRKIANKIINHIFKKIYKKEIKDTQSGLRIFPKEILPILINIKGERFEYEMNVLKYYALNNIKINQIPIQTIYLKTNKSHYKTLKDSLKILKIVLNKKM